MARDLSRVGERERLKAKREPHWQRLALGSFLGFRPSKAQGAGTWIARALDPESHKYRHKTLGEFSDLSGNARFSAAKKEAEAFAELVQTGSIIAAELETVADACREYAKSKPDAEGRFQRNLYSDPLAKVRLDKLRRHHIQSWRDRLESKPALVTRRKAGEKVYRQRSPATVNREMAVLRAALAKVLAPGPPGSNAAWQEPLRCNRNADGRRTLYLDRGERLSLLSAVDQDARNFLEALCLLPFRPGALAQLTVGDFDHRTSELTIGKDKNGNPRRIELPEKAAALFAKLCMGRSPHSILFLRKNGQPWSKDNWNAPIARAIKMTGIPAQTTAYTLRHSTITDLVRLGVPLLTIAQISNTSVEMIERHYGHLGRESTLQALSRLEL